ncbi:MAG: YggS family pyridoxal phosphate-dependent enzyme [Rhodospirillales bacterium]|nr:YggS family pyridoxal phosphate-dependent enzyme [Rhodospirillales bacterium]
MDIPGIDVADTLQAVRHALERAAAGRAVTLVAVSKTQPADHIRPALVAGQRIFGENRVREAKQKWPVLRQDFAEVELHLIGPLQTNKVREAVALFDVIETVDRPALAQALAAEMERSGRRPRCLIQINTGAEPQKAGILPGESDAFIETCRSTYGLPVEGLMCIPPVDENPEPHFRLLAAIAARHGLKILSMGMSGDYECAVRCGATHVRVGTAIFGHRA